MKKKRICLVNTGRRTLYSSLVSPPMGILYIAAYLRDRLPADITVINQKLDNIDEDTLARRIASLKPDIVGLSVMTPSSWILPFISARLRELLPEVLIVAGGAHITGTGPSALAGTEVDLGFRGEGETVFAMIAERFPDRSGYYDIPGLIVRGPDGEITENSGTLPQIKDPDTLPMPAYDLINIHDYWKVQSMLPVPRRKYISLFSSRGCPYGCIYCHSVFRNGYRVHSAERMVEEIGLYQKRYGITEIEFLDDIFNLDRKRLLRFCELIRSRGIKVKIAFPNGLRGDIFREDELDALADAGMHMASFALESGSERIQESCGKRLNIGRYLKNVEYAVKKGVFINGFAMLGFPTETAEEMQMTIDVACMSRLHSISFFTVTPYPGSRIYTELMNREPSLISGLDYREITSCHGMINLSAEPDHILHYYQRKANMAFYLSPSRIARLLRDHPQPWLLPLYFPEFLKRATKGFSG